MKDSIEKALHVVVSYLVSNVTTDISTECTFNLESVPRCLSTHYNRRVVTCVRALLVYVVLRRRTTLKKYSSTIHYKHLKSVVDIESG